LQVFNWQELDLVSSQRQSLLN